MDTRLQILIKKYSTKYINKKIKSDWVIYLFYQKDNSNSKNCHLYGMKFSDDSFLISETIFPDKLFDEIFADFALDFSQNLEPQKSVLFNDDKTNLSFKNVIKFERLLWLNHYYRQSTSKNNDLSHFQKLQEFLLVKNNILYTNIYPSKSDGDLSNDFSGFLWKTIVFLLLEIV